MSRLQGKLDQIILALDFENWDEAMVTLNQFCPPLTYVKVGLEAYYAHGAKIIEELQKRNLKIFLDLKLHDIPTTMEKSLRVLAKLNVDMINVHAFAGSEALKRCKDVIKTEAPNTKLIAVTILTSFDQANLSSLHLEVPLSELALNLAQQSYIAGLDGVVCSAFEAPLIKKNISGNFITVTPGIRLNAGAKQDQKRVLTPNLAFANGSDYLVMGRELTKASNSQKILTELKDHLYVSTKHPGYPAFARESFSNQH